jgi:hypothetical protein
VAHTKGMNRSFLWSGLIIFGAALLGLTCSLHSWGGRIFITETQAVDGAQRVPASIRRHANISELEGNPLRLASQRRLLEDMKVFSEPERVGFQLGHFLTKNEEGRAAYACDVYKQIVMTFEGEGIADSGDKPVMEVLAPCQQSADLNVMETIWIPLRELRDRTPSTIEVGGPLSQTTVKFKNTASEWPSQWALQSVRLSRNEDETAADVGSGEADLSVSGDELRALVKKPVVIAP